MENLLCSVVEAGKTLGIGRSKVYELISNGGLKTVTIGRRRLVLVGSVRALALGEAA